MYIIDELLTVTTHYEKRLVHKHLATQPTETEKMHRLELKVNKLPKKLDNELKIKDCQKKAKITEPGLLERKQNVMNEQG